MLSPKTGRLVPATCGSSGPGDLSQHDARLLTSGAVDVVIAEEDLRSGSARVTYGPNVVQKIDKQQKDEKSSAGLFKSLKSKKYVLESLRSFWLW